MNPETTAFVHRRREIRAALVNDARAVRDTLAACRIGLKTATLGGAGFLAVHLALLWLA